jgi:hypothetical protein
VRTGQTKDGPSYSPDDNDLIGFRALMARAVEEHGVAVSSADLERFCQFWADRRQANLRTAKQWAAALRTFVRRPR